MSDLPRVKVVNLNDDRIGTECYINEKKIECVKAVDFRVAVDEVPIFTIETMGAPDIDMSGDICFSFTPKTIREAVMVLRNELLKHGDFYNGFLASMRSAIDDKFWDSRNYNGYMCDIGDEDFDEAAELMLKRIIGEE